MNNTTTTVKGYVLNLVEGKIVITRRFEKKAMVYGSDEYTILTGLRKDFPEFKIEIKEIKKNDNKKSYEGLTIEEMKRFVSTRSEEEKEALERVIKLADDKKKSKYGKIKKWFLDNYKDIYVPEIETIKVKKTTEKDTTSKEELVA